MADEAILSWHLARRNSKGRGGVRHWAVLLEHLEVHFEELLHFLVRKSIGEENKKGDHPWKFVSLGRINN